MTDGTYRPPSNVASVDGQFRSLSSAPLILLVDDNPHIAASLAVAMRLAGLELHWAAEPEGALSRIAVHCYEAILLDLNYTAGRADGIEGLALLQRILEEDPSARVLVITAHSGVRIAVEAMRAGACDFVMKPWRNAELLAKLERARTTQGFAAMQPATRHLAEPSRLIGESAAMSHVRDLIRRVGPTMAGVLVTGLPGSGRTLVAAAIHAASARASRKLVRVDLRDEEAWSRLDQAEETLLLAHSDRLSELEQLRLLERLPTEARILATADRADGVHPALARRVAAVEVAVPPLALRGDDVLLLARHFARVAAERHGRPPPRLTPAAEAALVSVDWPDQVRGLAAAIERAVLLGDGGVIDAALLGQPAAAPAPVTVVPSSRFDLERNERAVIEAALREHHHNVTHAASALGLSRGALYRRMERYGL